MNLFEKYIDVLPEIKDALDNNEPVVSLESTIISHGMPYPKNVETATEVENIVRKNGAIPATIAIIDGRIKIGLDKNQLEFMGNSENILKASRRDIPYIIANKLSAATTVSATMICSNLSGIRTFATGGIGGVHRNASETFDISADLQELSSTNVCVICAGAKAILDLKLTLEYLETLGVPVLGYKTEELPAFYSRESGLKVNYKVESPEEIACIMKSKWDLNINGGVLVTNPIPKKMSMNTNFINKAIDASIEEADSLGIEGKELTPFLLAKIKDLTGGSSLESNIALVYNNAELAAKIALEYSNLLK
ncbi:pseudouridine-5'-phosphate glycosidase [Oceanotoga sp. DSM 15011]|jgi:pseudouridine-5'-phosphate glycosidase|uniref:pseudouridine-5'-phosphate glycosidase n=1 Tax=Oceanotoga sp. DSM 15011 TaxID=2984951 RepID=UPI0021F40558|nr:pseudouridine-5'-phosphate glycosidase [Oceanotoga sp. DSM 15011]UYP00527.1 pseudouridine-5'-phosphate glycosidase [Oceanotoga sp. DSM 15011]